MEEATELAPISPELILVTPELRPAACRSLGPPPRAHHTYLRAETALPQAPAGPTSLRALTGTVEVDLRVPVILVILVWASFVVLRAAALLAIPLIGGISALWLLSVWYG